MFELFAVCLQSVCSIVHRGGLLVLLHINGFFECSAADLQEHEDTTQSPL